MDKIFNENHDIDFDTNYLDFEIKWNIRRYATDSLIKTNGSRIIGMHWYNGHPLTKNFLNLCDYNKNLTINNMINKYIKIND